jgi:hypothetical protein
MSWKPAPIIGGAYSDDAKAWSCQDTVNWIPVAAERSGSRTPTMLRGAPGMRTFCITGSGQPIRGAHNVEGLLLVVSGTTLYRVSTLGAATALGTIPGVERVSMAHNQITGGSEVAIANGQGGYIYNTVTGTLTQITDDGFPGAISFDFCDGYIMGVEPGRRFAFHSQLAAAGDYNTLDRYEAEGSPDKLVGQIVTHREWWLFGERTIEPYVNTGEATGTFQRSSGTVIEVGAASRSAIVQMDNSVFWLGNDGVVYRANGYAPQRISTHAIEQAISRCNLAQAFAFTFEDRGHKIFYLTFPDGMTWGYDAASGEWHRRKSDGLDRWRINTLTRWNGHWIAGDYTNGKLYELNWDVQDEDGAVLERRRVTGVLSDNQNRVTVDGVALVFDTGTTTEPKLLLPPLSLSGHLPNGPVGEVVNYQYTVSGGVLPRVVSIASGALPAGLSISASGLVTGTRTTYGSTTWTLKGVDANGALVLLDDENLTTKPSTLDPATLGSDGGTGGVVASDNLTITKNTDSGGFSIGARVYSADAKTSGKYYFEATVLVSASRAAAGMCVGLENASRFNLSQSIHVGTGTLELGSDGTFYQNGAYIGGGGPSFNANGATIGIAVDLSTGKWWWRNASGWNTGGDPATGANPKGTLSAAAMTGGVLPYVIAYASNGSIRANFGNAPFALGDVPEGFNPGWGLFA